MRLDLIGEKYSNIPNYIKAYCAKVLCIILASRSQVKAASHVDAYRTANRKKFARPHIAHHVSSPFELGWKCQSHSFYRGRLFLLL